MRNSNIFFTIIKLPLDFVMLMAAGATAYILRTKFLNAVRPVLFEFNLPLSRYLYLIILVSFLFLAAYAISGLYSMKFKIGRIEEFLKILIASSAGVMIVIVYIFLRQELFNSRFLVLGGGFFAVLFVFSGRLIIRYFQRLSVARYDFGTNRTLVIGDDTAAFKIVGEIKDKPSLGHKLVSHLSDINIDEIEKMIKNSEINEIILANPNYPADKIIKLVDLCQENHLIFKFIPNIFQTLTNNFDIDIMNGLPLIELKRTALDGWGRVIKRISDIILACLGLIVLLPIFAAVAFVIKWESAGPVFVRLKRVSKNKMIDLLKFRSMIKNAEELKPYLVGLNERKDGPLFKIKQDPRITGVGKFLRKYRIDELPQFWNILRGDISLIGPRPHQPDEIDKYRKDHKRVLAIKAGATGLAQVSGSSDLPFDQEVALDVFYMENWSLTLDLKIILKTVWKMLNDKSAV